MIVVAFVGGLAGDLITAVIDSNSCVVTTLGKVQMPFYRKTLKRGVLTTIEEKDAFITDISKQYRSIPSHEVEYHVQRNHITISIDVRDKELYKFAAERFILLNEPNLANTLFGVNTAIELAPILINMNERNLKLATNVLYFDDILDGKLIEKLEPICSNLDVDFYDKWLKHWGNR
jgi:hypothetical protein